MYFAENYYQIDTLVCCR